MGFPAMIRKPSAFLPVLMSLGALLTVLAFLSIYGVIHEIDEGTAAHIWQLLMAAQLPIIAFSPSSGSHDPHDRPYTYWRFKRSPSWRPLHRSTSSSSERLSPAD